MRNVLITYSKAFEHYEHLLQKILKNEEFMLASFKEMKRKIDSSIQLIYTANEKHLKILMLGMQFKHCFPVYNYASLIIFFQWLDQTCNQLQTIIETQHRMKTFTTKRACCDDLIASANASDNAINTETYAEIQHWLEEMGPRLQQYKQELEKRNNNIHYCHQQLKLLNQYRRFYQNLVGASLDTLAKYLEEIYEMKAARNRLSQFPDSKVISEDTTFPDNGDFGLQNN